MDIPRPQNRLEIVSSMRRIRVSHEKHTTLENISSNQLNVFFPAFYYISYYLDIHNNNNNVNDNLLKKLFRNKLGMLFS